MSIAPWQVELCAINPEKEGVGEACERLYAELQAAGIEVLYDDRGEKAGSMFSDADLLGIPLRLVVSPRTLAEKQAEFKVRGSRDAERIALDAAVSHVAARVEAEMEKYR